MGTVESIQWSIKYFKKAQKLSSILQFYLIILGTVRSQECENEPDVARNLYLHSQQHRV